ncbi:MAG: hypothetical protein NTX23_09330 [Candidatus Bipolaricaulota bacterium]|nr:hypothetical protein [Candidatus Bipolaricaulota bacterium]
MRRPIVSLGAALLCAIAVAAAGSCQEDPRTILAGLPGAGEYPDQDIVVLLVETTQWLDPSPPDGGRAEWVIREHCRYWFKTDAGAQATPFVLGPAYGAGAVSFAYVRVILPSGGTVSPEAVEPIDPSGSFGLPYMHRFVFPEGAICVGSILEYEAETRSDAPPGYVAGAVPLSPVISIVLERHTIETPPGQELSWSSVGDFGLRVRKDGSTYEFTVLDVEQPETERSAPCLTRFMPALVFTTAPSWSEVADGERAMTADPSAAAPFLTATANGIVRGLETREAKIERLFRYVRDTISYGTTAGWDPNWAASSSATLARGTGDCKGKAALLVSLLRAIGVEAYPTLMSSSCRSSGLLDERRVSGTWNIDHVVVAVRGASEPEWQILDPTCATCGVEDTYVGKTVWILDGAPGSLGTLYTPPWQPVDERTIACSVAMTVEEDGRVSVHGTMTVPENLMPEYVSYLNSETPGIDIPTQHWPEILGLDASLPDTKIAAWSESDGEPTVVSFEYSDTTNRAGSDAMPVCSVRVRECPSHLPVDFPRSPYDSARDAPFETAPIVETCTATVEIPPSSRVQIPSDVHLAAPGVTFDATYVRDGTRVEITRRFAITTDLVMPEDYAAFVKVADRAAQEAEQPITWSE